MEYVAKEMKRREMDLPLLIGGATTSKQHTAIKIAPHFQKGSTFYVADASRAVGVVSRLINTKDRDDFRRQNAEVQERLCEVYGRKAAKPLASYEAAQANRLKVDWSAPQVQPAWTGRRELRNFPLADIVPFIDWTFFFNAWELKGRFPQILDHPRYGEAARELYANAQEMLDRIVTENLLRAHATWGFWPADTDGDDIVLYADDRRDQELMRFNMLRQQEEKLDDKLPHRSLADFVAPRGSGASDSVGAFAVAAGEGVDELVGAYEEDHDDYNAIMVKALADRLAEAFAELLHKKARTEVWGIEEDLASEDLVAEKYRGIRPAFGYPASPDHSEKAKLWQLLDAESVGMTLTESFAVLPTAAVNGLYFAHPQARYFAVGRVGRDQVISYAERKGDELKEIERWLAPYLAYDPEDSSSY